MKKYFQITAFIAAAFIAIATHAEETEKSILCTTFPVYQVTRNVAEGCSTLKVKLLLPASTGCPHSYSLTTSDMRKLAKADALVINGAGLEDFLGTPIMQAHSSLKVIDSSKDIANRIKKDVIHGNHTHSEVNPHFFTSPLLRARMASTIAAGLAELVPDEKELMESNASNYTAGMQALSEKLTKSASTLVKRRIVQQHGAFDYLARDLGLEIVAEIQQDDVKPSASQLLALIKIIKKEKAAAIFTEPQYSARLAKTISAETGIPVKVLNPTASGPADAELDYFETEMNRNMEILRATLETVK